ncbi:hypothetical protein FAI40_09845 [Acetobacteraceae bacterium]|nr:hypothetical protein FAI40_09845 [Acetobacteraceae bacterium]
MDNFFYFIEKPFLKKSLPPLFFAIGSACFIFLAINNNINAIFKALLRVGFLGFFFLLFLSLINYLILALAWKSISKKLNFFQIILSRMIRDSAGSCLPLSQIGGILIGTYATITLFQKKKAHELTDAEKENLAATSNLMDVTLEAIAQVLFIFTALFLLLISHQNGDVYFKTVGVSALLLSLGLYLFILIQRNLQTTTNFLNKYITSKKWKNLLKEKISQLNYQFLEIWKNPHNILKGIFLHYIAWTYSAFLTWTALHLLKMPISWKDCFIFEGISCGIISTFFFVPTSIGIQEGAYISLGYLFGVPAEVSFSLSLLRRGREIFIGAPILLLWEIRQLIKNSQQK